MTAGRPSTYDSAYCEQVIEYGKQGKSRAWIAATLGVSRQTLHNWEAEHPEFLDAMDQANLHAQLWWEDAGQDGMISGDAFNASIWSRSMAARFPKEWRESKLIGSDPDNPLPTGITVHLVKTDATANG